MAVDNTKETHLTHYLKIISEVAGQASVAAYVTRNGRQFESAELTDQEMEYVRRIQWNRRPPKQCYLNAQMEAMTLPKVPGIDLKYVEGFVDPDVGFGLDHAWLSVNGKIVDVTLRIGDTDDRVVGNIPEDWEYIGVEMDPKVCFHIFEHQAAIPIIDDTRCGRPMIQKDLEAKRSTKLSTTTRQTDRHGNS